MTTRKGKREYDIGYKRPPKHTRFKKGQSGNPDGRPPRPHSLQGLMREILLQKIEVTENGKRKRMTRREALLLSIYTRAIQGDRAATALLVRLEKELFKANPDDHVVYVFDKALTEEEFCKKHGIGPPIDVGTPPVAKKA